MHAARTVPDRRARTRSWSRTSAVTVIGRRDGLPDDVLARNGQEHPLSAANTGMRLCLAINYGGRAELVDAVQADRRRSASAASCDPTTSTRRRFGDHLYTAGMPDPDLLIRTAGEMRVSNFLLWQICYAEIWVTPAAGPNSTATCCIRPSAIMPAATAASAAWLILPLENSSCCEPAYGWEHCSSPWPG